MPAAGIAARFVAARQNGHGLASFPGLLPSNLDDAYAIQRAAIALWPDAIAGWKVRRLSPALAARFGLDRFVGPVFAASVARLDKGKEADFPVFVGGSAAFEAEYVMVAHADQPLQDAGFDTGRARRLIGTVRIGVEVAGSPLAAMPDLDSLASIADFGNNNGQIFGPDIPLAALDDPRAMTCSTSIDGIPVRSASAADLPGGPLAAFAFALDQCARLGFPLTAGQFVSTGAVTGMHRVRVGQRCTADFGAFGRIACLTVPIGRT